MLSGRKIEDIIIVDNRVCSYGLNLENGIPIKDFMGDKNDTELFHLTHYIKSKLLNCSDVRKVLK